MMKNINLLRAAGVTLLEIILVLALSASILIMSVRYYGSATSSLHANNTIEQVQAITATIDNYTAGLSYASISTTFVENLLPKHTLKTSWGTNVFIDNVKPSSYQVTLPRMPVAICALIRNKLESNNHYKIMTSCGEGATDFSYQYLANA